MIPARYAQILFAFLLSILMSFIITFVATIRTIGPEDAFIATWFGTWLSAWLVAFPTVMFVAPLTRRLVAKLVKAD